MKYRTKEIVIDALRWNPLAKALLPNPFRNDKEIERSEQSERDVACQYCTYGISRHVRVFVNNSEWELACPGNWIIMHKNVKSILTEDEFTALYIPVGTKEAKTVWQACMRGGEPYDWRDCENEDHAEMLRKRGFIVRKVVVMETNYSNESMYEN